MYLKQVPSSKQIYIYILVKIQILLVMHSQTAWCLADSRYPSCTKVVFMPAQTWGLQLLMKLLRI